MVDDATVVQGGGVAPAGCPGGKGHPVRLAREGGCRGGQGLGLPGGRAGSDQPWAEGIRLRDVLCPLRISVDVLVASRASFDCWRETPDTVYYEVAQEGKVFDRSREWAQLLMGKAAQDECAMEKLAPDPASSDEVIGFHAQQTVEANCPNPFAALLRYEYVAGTIHQDFERRWALECVRRVRAWAEAMLAKTREL